MKIVKPTLLLNTLRARRNIEHMAQKARQCRVRFRPHFKTHQAARIGEWFKECGVRAITVSSFDMAASFARHGWQDIMVAFPLNILEIDAINALASKITLHVLVESEETVEFLKENLLYPVHAWIKVDTGYKRTGIPWNNYEEFIMLAGKINAVHCLSLQGVLTHSGQSYTVNRKEEVQSLYADTMFRMKAVQTQLQKAGCSKIEISIGDTPSCCVLDEFPGADEIRPGNFVFCDVMQVNIGSCTEENLAVAVACPVVAKHPERLEIVMYGGAVHLSKESITHIVQGRETKIFGYVAATVQHHLDATRKYDWGPVIPSTYVASLTQEHGIVKTDETFFTRIRVGDVLMVLPVHACLTVNLLRKYLTLEGEIIEV